MALFLREHLVLIVVQSIQFIVMIGLFWLAGYRDVELTFYSLFLGFFFLGCYLLYQYVSRRAVYHRLQTEVKTFDESIQSLGETPLGQALEQLQRSQYKLYAEDIAHLNKKQDEHHAFLDRWIHQMKTPVSVIELLAQELDEPESSDVREETERLKTELNTVLYMARLRSVQTDYHIKQVNLVDIVNSVNNDNKRLFIRNKIYPEVKEQTENVHVESDEKWLFFILSQIIQNAIKYSANEANTILIEIDHVSGKGVCQITDYGVGIPLEDKRRLFDMFFTGENGRKFRESTGVGLYLVKEVADYLGHDIEVESIVGEGTTFRIIF